MSEQDNQQFTDEQMNHQPYDNPEYNGTCIDESTVNKSGSWQQEMNQQDMDLQNQNNNWQQEMNQQNQNNTWQQDMNQQNQNGYQQNYNYQNGYQQNYPKQGNNNGFAIASLIMGILSLLLFCTCINIPLAIMSIIFGALHITRKCGGNGMAIGGIVTSAISIVLLIAMFAVVLAGGMNWQQEMLDMMQNNNEYNFEENSLQPQTGGEEFNENIILPQSYFQ